MSVLDSGVQLRRVLVRDRGGEFWGGDAGIKGGAADW